jgi:hypothetical protein
MANDVDRASVKLVGEGNQIINVLLQAEFAAATPRLRVVVPQADGDGSMPPRERLHLGRPESVVIPGAMDQDYWHAGAALGEG